MSHPRNIRVSIKKHKDPPQKELTFILLICALNAILNTVSVETPYILMRSWEETSSVVPILLVGEL